MTPDDKIEVRVRTAWRPAMHAIEATFSARFLSDPAHFTRIERREISNFEKTLRPVLPDNRKLQDVTLSVQWLDDYASS